MIRKRGQTSFGPFEGLVVATGLTENLGDLHEVVRRGEITGLHGHELVDVARSPRQCFHDLGDAEPECGEVALVVAAPVRDSGPHFLG